jgi:DNA oxidative demethylase
MSGTLFTAPRRELGPGAMHLPGWLDLEGQRRLVAAFAEWAAGPVPARAAVLPGGHPMSVRTVCLGWHWRPYRYTRTADDVNGARVLDFPDWLGDLGRQVLADAYDEAAAAYRPDTALVNWYDPIARMGMHQDKDEVAADPVVSLSVGDSCVFRFGNPQTRGRPYTDVTLASGDAVVFGRESRFAYHAVPRILPGTADPATGLREGRINVTMRVTGLDNGPHAD